MTFAPALLGGIGTFLTVAQTGMNIAGSIIGAASEAEAARKAAEIAEKNKKIAGENADRALNQAQIDQYELDMETAQLLGEQEAIQAGSGLRLDSESFIHTREDARRLGRQDALRVREAGEIRAQAYRNEEDAYMAEVLAAHRAEGNAGIKGFLNVGTSLIGGASQLAKAAPTRRTNTITVPAATRL